jgi:predicted HTH transcriptional regulator
MTNREFLNAVATNDTLPEDVRAYANASIEKLDAALAARKNKPSKKAVENAPIIEQIVNEVLGTEAMTASQVAEVVGISVQKASALLRAIVADGRAVATDIKVPNKGTCKGYTLAD